MKLYHGTALAHLESIKANGIRPRGRSKVSNWEHSIESNPKAVYLTSSYPFHFAFAACQGNEHGLILEIDELDLGPTMLAPDEDFLEQWTRGRGSTASMPELANVNWDMKRRTRHYRKLALNMGMKYLAGERTLTDLSLTFIGTAAYYGTIPWSFVKRYVAIDWKKVPQFLLMSAIDTQVSMLNHRYLHERHKALVKWFMGDPVTPEELELSPAVFEMIPGRREALEAAIADRSGLTVEILQWEESIEQRA